MMKRCVILVILLAVMISGCGNKPEKANEAEEQGSTPAASSSQANTADQSSSPKSPKEMKYKIYENARYGYHLSYPDIYSISSESDNKDGLSLATDDLTCTLQMWGTNNVLNDTGKTLLESAKERTAESSGEYAEDDFYWIEYSGGEDSEPLTFYESGYITGGYIIGFVISYPEEEKDTFAGVIIRMTDDLKTNKR